MVAAAVGEEKMVSKFSLDPWLSAVDKQSIMAGAAGAVLSLLFIGGVSWRVALQAVVAGVVSAYYFTPVAMHFLHWSADLWSPVGFVIGLAAMSTYTGLFAIFAMWREDPGGFLQRILAVIPAFRK
jgi:hypothetical protein